MNVQMHNSLSSCFTTIYSNVVAIRRIFNIKHLLNPINHFYDL